MSPLPTDWSALCALVFLLGMRHGFDADHLATIDGLTRLNQKNRSGFGAWCGTLFSLGHGAIVVLVALIVGSASEQWKPPAWFEGVGSAVSIAFLLGLGIANLRAVLLTQPGQIVRPVGFKARWLGSLSRARSPAGVAGVGALFALSFDTLSQSALFAATASQYGGVVRALFLAILFTLGMLATDGLNGWWMGRMIARTDQVAVIASQVMGVAVAGVSLCVAGLSISKLALPVLEDWIEANGLAVSVVVVCVVALAYGLALWLARRQAKAMS